MKKFLLTVVAVMTMTFGYAETEGFRSPRNIENYDMSFDMRRLAAKLDLTAEQMDAVEVIQSSFNHEVKSAATAHGFQRRAMVRQAVRKDVHQMLRVLNDKQFSTYMMLLGTTLKNKGI